MHNIDITFDKRDIQELELIDKGNNEYLYKPSLPLKYENIKEIPKKHFDSLIRADMKENTVRILIWSSYRGGKLERRGCHMGILMRGDGDNFKHVSLYHPSADKVGAIKRFLKFCFSQPGEIVEQYSKDMEYEFRHPKFVIEIKNLDVNRMMAHYDEINSPSDKLRWQIFGWFGKKHYNCATLVYELLEAGGFFKKLKPFPGRDFFIKKNKSSFLDAHHYSPGCYNFGTCVLPIGIGAVVFLCSFLAILASKGKYEKEEWKEAGIASGILMGAFFLYSGFKSLYTLYNSNEIIPSFFPFIENLVKLAVDIRCEDVSLYKVQNTLDNSIVLEQQQRAPLILYAATAQEKANNSNSSSTQTKPSLFHSTSRPSLSV